MDRLAINQRMALMMFWNEGFDTEDLLNLANEALKDIKQPTTGFYYPEDISRLINELTSKHLPHLL
jgi:hypothetical protein